MPYHEINVKNVKIDDKFWNKRIRSAVENIVPYQWRVLNDQEPGAAPSHAVMNFKIAAGMELGEFYGYQFQDSDLAKWIEASSFSLIYQDSPQVRAALDQAISIIEKAQQPDGYLDTHYILKNQTRNGRKLPMATSFTARAICWRQLLPTTLLPAASGC